MTRRFEYTDATSSKFWEITVADATVTVCFGRIGTAGQTQTKPHDSAAAATAAAEQQVAGKVKKGYREIGVDGAPVGETSPNTADAVDRKQLAQIRKLLGQADAAAVWQGIALLRALDNPALWAMLAEGASVDAEGEVHTPSGSEIHKRVRAGFRASVALWALTYSGRLRNTRQLLIRGYAFADYTFTQALPTLEVLDVKSSPSITDLAGLQGLNALTSLYLAKCGSLTAVTGLHSLPALDSIWLYSCKSLTDLTGLRDLPALTRLVLWECRSLTDLTALGDLPALTNLSLHYCKSVTDLTGLHDLPALTTITVRGCTSLTTLTGLRNLPALTSLDVYGCRSLTDLTALGDLPALTAVSVDGHTRLKDRSALHALPARTM